MEAVLKVKTNQFLCVWEREYGGTVKDFPRSVYLWRYGKVPVTDYVINTVNYKTFRRLPCFLTASVSFPSSKAPSFSVSLCCFAEMTGTCIAIQRPTHEHYTRTLSILFFFANLKQCHSNKHSRAFGLFQFQIRLPVSPNWNINSEKIRAKTEMRTTCINQQDGINLKFK